MIPWLMSLLICTEPFPAECSRPTIDQITSNPMCIAASKSCTLHQRWVYVPGGTGPKETANACADAAAALVAEERQKGYRRTSMPECLLMENEP